MARDADWSELRVEQQDGGVTTVAAVVPFRGMCFVCDVTMPPCSVLLDHRHVTGRQPARLQERGLQKVTDSTVTAVLPFRGIEYVSSVNCYAPPTPSTLPPPTPLDSIHIHSATPSLHPISIRQRRAMQWNTAGKEIKKSSVTSTHRHLPMALYHRACRGFP